MAQVLANDRLKSEGRVPARALGKLRPRLLQSQDLSRHILQIHATLAAAVLDGATPLSVAARYGELMGLPVVLYGPELKAIDGHGELNAVAPTGKTSSAAADVRQVRIISSAVGPTVKRSYVASVLVPNGLFGYLVMEADADSAIDDDIVMNSMQQAATLCALAVIRQRGGVELSNEVRRDLIASLLLRRETNPVDTTRLMEMSGLSRGGLYRVLSAAVVPQQTDGGRRETPASVLLQTLAAEITSRSPRSITAIGDMELTSLIPECGGEAPAPNAATVAKDAVARARAMFPTIKLAAGLGRIHAAPRGLANSFGEARNALHVRQRLTPSSGLLSYEDLGVYSLIYQVSDSSELTGFVERVLGAMLAYDRKRQTDLVPTLRAILENNGSMLNASRAVGVHVNTVAYRSQRMQSISGLDLASSEDRLKAHLALKILDGLSSAERDAICSPPVVARSL